MNYTDVYFSRVTHMGTSVAEVARNSGIRSFQKWLAESPNTVEDLSVERGLYFKGIILTNKDKEHKKIMSLHVAVDIPLLIGDIVNWEKEKWIIFQKERKVRETHQTFYMIRCNYLIKWVDELGHLQQSWCHFTSSLDSKVKENFRTWNSLITPQPNKYAEMILPRTEIKRWTRFIVEDEGWYEIEYDHTSVPGIMYVSLCEEKVNSLTDDLENDIADVDTIAKYAISAPAEKQSFLIGDIINPIYTITKNGKPIKVDVIITPKDKKVIKYVDNELKAVGIGEAALEIQLKDFPDIKLEMSVIVGESIADNLFYIEGNSSIKLNRTEIYTFVSKKGFSGEIVFSINDTNLAEITKVEENKCFIKANGKNKTGSIILLVTYLGKEYSKEIKIVPLW